MSHVALPPVDMIMLVLQLIVRQKARQVLVVLRWKAQCCGPCCSFFPRDRVSLVCLCASHTFGPTHWGCCHPFESEFAHAHQPCCKHTCWTGTFDAFVWVSMCLADVGHPMLNQILISNIALLSLNYIAWTINCSEPCLHKVPDTYTDKPKLESYEYEILSLTHVCKCC